MLLGKPFVLSVQTFRPFESHRRLFCHFRKSFRFLQDSNSFKRMMFSFICKSFHSKKEYKATKLVGYSPEQMYSIVSDVGNYKTFLPFCKKSLVVERKTDFLKGQLEIGFPPLVESYTSYVTLKQNELVKAVCSDSRLFEHLVNVWKFDTGIKDTDNTAVVTFYLSFKFKSIIYSQMANVFFNELVHQMENAFLKEARRRYGKPSVATQSLKSISKK